MKVSEKCVTERLASLRPLLLIVFLLLLSFAVGWVVYITYIYLQPSLVQTPEESAFKLTLLIFLFSELTFIVGLLIMKRRKTITPIFLLSTLFLNKHIQSLINFIIFSVILAAVSWMSTSICYQIYESFVVTPPIENMGFGMLLFFVMFLVFFMTLITGIFVKTNIYNIEN